MRKDRKEFAESIRSGDSLIPSEPFESAFDGRRLSPETKIRRNLTTDAVDNTRSPTDKHHSPSTTDLLRRRRRAARQSPPPPLGSRGEGGAVEPIGDRATDDDGQSKVSRRSARKVERELQMKFLRRLLEVTMSAEERRLRRLTDRHLDRLDFDVQQMPLVSSWAGALLMPAVDKSRLNIDAGESGLIISAHLAKGSKSKELAHIVVDPNNGMQVAIRLDPLGNRSTNASDQRKWVVELNRQQKAFVIAVISIAIVVAVGTLVFACIWCLYDHEGLCSGVFPCIRLPPDTFSPQRWWMENLTRRVENLESQPLIGSENYRRSNIIKNQGRESGRVSLIVKRLSERMSRPSRAKPGPQPSQAMSGPRPSESMSNDESMNRRSDLARESQQSDRNQSEVSDQPPEPTDDARNSQTKRKSIFGRKSETVK